MSALSGPNGALAIADPATALRGRDGRRVPGHRPGSVADPASRVRRGRHHAGADRRSQAGDLRVPRRRRLRLPGGRGRTRRRCATLPINWRSDQGLVDAARSAAVRGQARPRGHPVPRRPRRSGPPAAAAARRAESGARCGSERIARDDPGLSADADRLRGGFQRARAGRLRPRRRGRRAAAIRTRRSPTARAGAIVRCAPETWRCSSATTGRRPTSARRSAGRRAGRRLRRR